MTDINSAGQPCRPLAERTADRRKRTALAGRAGRRSSSSSCCSSPIAISSPIRTRCSTDYGFGRAHHRVLHFVDRNPGLTVAELLDILKITKQSLGRVLKQLSTRASSMQREGPEDRRQRLLSTDAEGRALCAGAGRPQIARIRRRAGARPAPDSAAVAERFL